MVMAARSGPGGTRRNGWSYSALSAVKRLEYLRSFLRFCQDSGWIETNPGKKTELSPLTLRTVGRALSSRRPTPGIVADELSNPTLGRRSSAFADLTIGLHTREVRMSTGASHREDAPGQKQFEHQWGDHRGANAFSDGCCGYSLCVGPCLAAPFLERRMCSVLEKHQAERMPTRE
jgi:hypothetical protein